MARTGCRRGRAAACFLVFEAELRVGACSLQKHARNRAYAWLLAALATACGLVLGIVPLTRQFGLPVEAALQWAGLLMIGSAALATLWLRRRMRFP